MSIAKGTIALAMLAVPALAAAQDPVPVSPADERRLTPEQVEAILAEAEKKNSAAAPRLAPEPADDDDAPPPIHGEFGIGIGTGGYREVFGTAIAPLGNNGAAIINIDLNNWNWDPDRQRR